jgi:hypothetical protein
MTGFNSKRDAAADKLHWSDCAVHNGPAYPAGPCDCGAAQEIERSEIFCGVDYADGVLAVSVMRRSPDGVAELLHSEQIELAQPAQEPVEYQMLILGGRWTHCAKHVYDAVADKSIVRALYTTPPKREWVGLTPEETSGFTQHEMTVVKYVSKVLQEKNG